MTDIYRLELNGPGKNSLGSDMMQSVLDRIGEADGRPILLTGAGDAFSAGLNLKEVLTLDGDGMRGFLELLERMCGALYAYPAPTAAAVNGHAIAGGCVVELCCDRRIGLAGSRGKIGLNEVALGLKFPPMVMEIARNRVPTIHQPEVLLGAGLYGMDDALRLGLLDEIADDPEAAASAWLTRVGAHPPAAYAATKQTLRGDGTVDAAEQARFVADILPAWTSPELKARIGAALKR